MTFDARLAVSAALDHLADRLGRLIGERFPTDLGGLPWTAVLERLDQIAGRQPRTYAASDLQAQLKILTRRLGALGFPFDDSRQTVSTLGRELTIVRNARAHGDAFSVLDAWRALDYCVRLLEHFDDDGATHARELRDIALEAYVAEQGLGASTSPPTQLPKSGPALPPVSGEGDVVVPPSEAFDRFPASGGSTLVGDDRLPFEPWRVVPVGDVSVLDDLPKHAAKSKVRAAAVEIVEAEGPVHLERLTALVGASFGIQRLHARRTAQIVRQIKQTGLTVDAHKFVWPEDVSPASWIEFRPNASDIDRPFHHISPVEIANALRFHRERLSSADNEAIERATLQTFGRSRRTKLISDHLGLALEVASTSEEAALRRRASAAAQVR